MKFLIQKIDGEVRHDFSFALEEAIRYLRWSQGSDADVGVKYLDYIDSDMECWNWRFKPFHRNYIPIGSVEFVLAWMKHFGVETPLPINIPDELNEPYYTNRPVINGNHMDIEDLVHGKWFVKSATPLKGFAEVLKIDDNFSWNIPAGNYQISEYIEIESEWRAFVYKGELVGLHNYSGDFKRFPQVEKIKGMIGTYKSAPVAYTLDVDRTFVIEVHDFFSCGLYGFSNYQILPYMYTRWHYEYLNKIK